MLVNFQSPGGTVFSIFAITSCTFQAICTTFAYTQIRREVKAGQKVAVKMRATQVTTHTTASQCLSTFVRISIATVGPSAIFYSTIVIQTMFGFLEPVTVVVYVMFFNSIGTLNAFGYFYNKRIKARGKESGGGGGLDVEGKNATPFNSSSGKSTSSATSTTFLVTT